MTGAWSLCMAHSTQGEHLAGLISYLVEVSLKEVTGRSCCKAPAPACWGAGAGGCCPDQCDSCLGTGRGKGWSMKRGSERSVASSANSFSESALREQAQENCVILQGSQAPVGQPHVGWGTEACHHCWGARCQWLGCQASLHLTFPLPCACLSPHPSARCRNVSSRNQGAKRSPPCLPCVFGSLDAF